MWGYVIVVVVMALAVAPLLHFLPSTAQKRQAAMREAAARAGLFVEFRDLPGYAPRLERMHRSERQTVYYGLRLPTARGAARERQAWWRSGNEWRAGPRRLAPLPAALEGLPETVLAAGLDGASCGVYWRESGDVEAVERIAGCLHAWRETLVNH
jgi:hypothetical protein